MGHYSDYYAEDARRKNEARKIELESQLADMSAFRSWHPDRPRKWRFYGKVEELYNQILTELKAELYDLRNY